MLLGLSNGASDGESSTASRERRRVALAAREVSSHFHDLLRSQQSSILDLQAKVDQLIGIVSNALPRTRECEEIKIMERLNQRVERLEILTVCSPVTDPSIDEVLHEAMLRKCVSQKEQREVQVFDLTLGDKDTNEQIIETEQQNIETDQQSIEMDQQSIETDQQSTTETDQQSTETDQQSTEKDKDISDKSVDSKDGKSSSNFVAGDLLQFVDSGKIHGLCDGNSTKYSQEKWVEVLQVGTSGKHDGWLEVRADRTQTGFVARGWLNPCVNGEWILALGPEQRRSGQT